MAKNVKSSKQTAQAPFPGPVPAPAAAAAHNPKKREPPLKSVGVSTVPVSSFTNREKAKTVHQQTGN